MTDATPTMNASEARIRLAEVIKPLRALLEVETILDAAVSLEREAKDFDTTVKERRAAIAQLDAEFAELTTRRENAEKDIKIAQAIAATTVEQAKRDAEVIRAAAGKEVSDLRGDMALLVSTAKNAAEEYQAAETAAKAAEDAIAKRILVAQDELLTTVEKLAAATAIIDRADKINRLMGG